MPLEPGMPFWLLWTVVTAAASGMVFLLPYWIAAAVYGAALGCLQWLLLRSRLARANWWIVAGLVGWPCGLAASYLVHWLGRSVGIRHLPIAVYSAAAGAALAFVQWLVLRHELQRAVWWIAVNAASWSLAFAIGYRLAHGGLSPVLAGSISGAIGGAVTGAVIVWLLRQSRETQRY